MQQLSDITILKVVNAGQFLGKENPSIGMSSEARRFMELCNEIDDFCNSAQVVTVYVRFPEAGQMCLAMGPDKRWYRVRVLSVMQTTLGPQVKCYLVDFAETLLVPHSKLRKAPLKFLKCPHQAKKYQLFGVQPVTLLTSMEDFSTTMQPVHKWDTAANEYVSALIKMETFDVMVEICHIDKDKEHHVILYLNTAKGLINLNQLLVNEDYAIAIDDIKGSLDGKCLPTASTPDGRTRTVLGSEYTSQSTTPDTSCSVSPIQSLTSVEKAGNKAFALMHSQKMYEGDSKVQKPGFRDSYTSPLEVDVTHEIKGDGRESKECATASSLDVEHESTSSLIGSSYTDAFKQRQKLEKASSDNVIMLTRDMEQDALVQRFIAGYSSVRQAEDSLLKKTHDSSTSLNKGTSYRLSTLKSMLQMVETQPSEPDSLRTPGFVESPNKPSAEASKSKGMRDERLYFVDERKMPVESIKSWQMKSLSSEYERFREPGDHLPPSIKRTSRSLMDQLTHHRGREEGLQTSPEFGQFRQPVEDENIKYEGTPEDPNTSQGLVVKKISPGTFFTRQAVEDLKHLSGYQDRKEEFGINAASVLKMNESPEAVFSKQVTKDQALLPDSKEKEANLRLSPSLGVTKNVSPETYFFKGRGKALGISPSIVKKNTSPEIIFSKGRGLKALGTSPSVVKKDTTPEKIFSKGRGIAIGASLSSVVNKNASPETVFSKGRGLKALATSPSSIVKKNTRPETVFSRQAPEDQQLLLGNKGKELTLTSPLLVLNKGRGLISRLPRCAEKKQMTTSDTVKSPTVSSKNWALDGSFNEEDVSSTDISTLIGQRIMKQLTGATDDRPIQNESSSLAGHVSVYGDLKPKPIIDINRTPFPDLLKQPLEDQGFPGPTLVQAYAWPSILRGRDFVGISARSTGKTLAYLLPALTQLLQASTYSKLPSGEGPLVLILSPSWKRAQFIYDNCKIFLQESESTRTLLLFGAGSEDTQIFSLLSGCEVLIATPSCLARLLEKSYTLLNRLCHLVFDDADLLMEDFPSQINDIMKSYAVCLSNHRGRCSPRQVIIMSTVWTAGIESLMKAYQVDPLIVLTSKVEAAVYSKVIQTVHVCLSSQRFALLLDELDSVLSRSKKTILFANTKSDAVCLQQLFSSYSHFSLLAHSDLMDHQMEMIRHEWKSNHRDDSNPILVMTDDVILDLGITDANCIIHFDFPPNKYKFGNRLGCMADNYGECHRKNAELDNPCMSLLFVTETCDRHIPSLVYLLNRIGDKQCIPKQLEDVLHQAIEMREQEKKDQDICAQLKAYGFCRDGVLCNSRHKVFADLEAPKLPVKGYVKVLITHVVDATHFYARVLEYRETENSPSEDSIASQYVQLLIKLTLWYGTSSRKIVVSTVFVNSMYAIEDKRKHTFQRVIVTAVKNEDNCDDVEVHYIDEGTSATVEMDQLLVLPKQFQKIPSQVIEVYACRVKPLDKDTDWTVQASYHVYEKINGKILDGKIVLCMGKTLWLDPLIERCKLDALHIVTNATNIRMELLKNAFARQNPEHVVTLSALCKGQIPICEYETEAEIDSTDDDDDDDSSDSDEVASEEYVIQTACMPDDEYCDVCVTYVDTPSLFYVQLRDNVSRLEDMMDIINSMNNMLPLTDNQCSVGRLCLAKFVQDNRWCRGMIISRCDNGQFNVYSVDYGDKETVPRNHIMQITDELLKLPFQAIACKLWCITPSEGDGWTVEAGDALWDLTTNKGNKKLMVAKVYSKETSRVCGTTVRCYNLELYDTSTKYDIVISQELAFMGHAVGSKPSAKMIFPGMNDMNLLLNLSVDSLPTALPNLCAIIYTSKDIQQKVSAANFIRQTILQSDMECILQHGNLGVLTQVLGYCGMPEVQESLLTCLEHLSMHSESVRFEISNEGGIKALCRMLLRRCEEPTIELVLKTLRNFAVEKRYCQEVLAEGGVHAVLVLLPRMKTSTCIVSGLLMLSTVLPKLDSFEDCINIDEVIQTSIQLICSRPKLLLKSGMQLLKLIFPMAKTVRNEQDIYRIIQSAIDAMVLDPKTRRVCSSLMTEFGGDVTKMKRPLHPGDINSPVTLRKPLLERPSFVQAKEDMIDLPPLEGTIEENLSCVHPKVLWSQRKDQIMLSIQLTGVKDMKLLVKDNVFKFSTILDGRNYCVDVDLYCTIENYKYKITGCEVLVELIKHQKDTKWPRLLQTKQKGLTGLHTKKFADSVLNFLDFGIPMMYPWKEKMFNNKVPYISIDFDRWQDDDSDTEKVFQRELLEKSRRRLNASLLDESDSDDSTDSDDSCSYSGHREEKVLFDDLRMGDVYLEW